MEPPSVWNCAAAFLLADDSSHPKRMAGLDGPRSVDLSVLRESKGILLISSTVNNVEDVCAVAGLAVVD